MILTCERCETRFRLDESRLPARGARVRCSRCKHAFFVRPPGASQADAIQEIAEQTVATGRAAPPEQSWDLEEQEAGRTAQSQSPARSAPVAEPPSDFEDESDWRFEDEVAQLGDTGASLDLPNGEAAAPPSHEIDRDESSFAELGDPESWDLLSSSSGDLPPPRTTPAPRSEPAPRPQAQRAPSAPVEAVSAARAPASPAAAEVLHSQPVLPAVEISPALRVAGWSATAALTTLVALLCLLPTAGVGAFRPRSVSVGPLVVEKLSARWVDNALAGPIWVVSGELHNPTSERHALGVAVDVALLDSAGDRIEGALATAQPALALARLREEDPEQLRDDASRAAADLAARLLEGDARVAFDAVFASAPAGAARFAVETRAAPSVATIAP